MDLAIGRLSRNMAQTFWESNMEKEYATEIQLMPEWLDTLKKKVVCQYDTVDYTEGDDVHKSFEREFGEVEEIMENDESNLLDETALHSEQPWKGLTGTF